MIAFLPRLNSIFPRLAYGDGGFGPSLGGKIPPVGDYSSSVGYLAYQYQTADGTSVSRKIDDLSTLLTAGRLSFENKQVLVDAHAYFLENHGIAHADRVLVKLLAATPEFHTTNTIRRTGDTRPVTPPVVPSNKPYKAIVYVNLAGGVDSFNILTPGGSCPLYDDYFIARGGDPGIGLKKTEIFAIDATRSKQVCTTFGVNKKLPAYKDIYNEGKGIFFANSKIECMLNSFICSLADFGAQSKLSGPSSQACDERQLAHGD